MFMSEEFATYQANTREVGSTKSQAITKDVDDGFKVQNVTFSSSSCRYQDNVGCSGSLCDRFYLLAYSSRVFVWSIVKCKE